MYVESGISKKMWKAQCRDGPSLCTCMFPVFQRPKLDKSMSNIVSRPDSRQPRQAPLKIKDSENVGWRMGVIGFKEEM